jgi:transcriptional regulator with XRE-family HTH domain
MAYMLNKRIGAKIRKQREFLGFTREGLCNHVNISPTFLSEVERGVKGISAETLYILCEGLGLSADYVLMGKEKPTDVSQITDTLMCMDEEYIPLAEELLRVYIKTILICNKTKDGYLSGST